MRIASIPSSSLSLIYPSKFVVQRMRPIHQSGRVRRRSTQLCVRGRDRIRLWLLVCLLILKHADALVPSSPSYHRWSMTATARFTVHKLAHISPQRNSKYGVPMALIPKRVSFRCPFRRMADWRPPRIRRPPSELRHTYELIRIALRSTTFKLVYRG